MFEDKLKPLIKVRKTVIIFVFIFVLFISGYFSVSNTIGKDGTYLSAVKYIIPNDIKIVLKETLFVFKNQQLLKSKLADTEIIFTENETELAEIKEQLVQRGNELNHWQMRGLRAKEMANDRFENLFSKPIVRSYIFDQISISKKKIFNDAINIRNGLIEDNILPKEIVKITNSYKELPRFVKFANVPEDDFEVFKARYYGIDHYGILEGHDGENLLIYTQGHGGNPYNFSYFLKIRDFFKKKNYDVLSLSMTGLGFNEFQENFDYPTSNDKLTLYKQHDNYHSFRSFFDPVYPKKTQLSLMLSGNYYLIKNIINNYDDVVMAGVSGGGWYTTVLPSLIPEIDSSFSFHGTVPLLFRTMFDNYGDWEQVNAKIYDHLDYWDFYFLSLIDNKGNVTREHSQIYRKDYCCFSHPAATIIKEIFDEKFENKYLTFYVLNNETFENDVQFIFGIPPVR